MTIERWVRTIAGFFIIVSLIAYNLSAPTVHIFTEANWLWFTLFVGINLFQSGLTGWCLLSNILKRLGVA